MDSTAAQTASHAAPDPQRRTQFDSQLLAVHPEYATCVCRNHGRHVMAMPDGSCTTALAWDGEQPLLRVYRDHELLAEHEIDGTPSAPCLVGEDGDRFGLWMSIGDVVCCAGDPDELPAPVAGVTGVLQDVVSDTEGRAVLAVSDDGGLRLVVVEDGAVSTQCEVDSEAGRASLDLDSAGRIHLAYENREGLEYRRYTSIPKLSSESASRVAEAYGLHPVISSIGDRIILAYLGESCRKTGNKDNGAAWQHLGRGGYVGALVLEDDEWRRHRLADSKQILLHLRHTDDAYEAGQNDILRARTEEYGPPALSLGPDGVPQVLWANVDRRWVYAARFLGDGFSPEHEVRGPFEQLTGPVVVPRCVPESHPGLPMGINTDPRFYLDRLALPSRAVQDGRQIDFLLSDELAESRGLEQAVNRMERHPSNPVLPRGEPGSYDEYGLVGEIYRDPDKEDWYAEYHYLNPDSRPWIGGGFATSEDGVHWTKHPPIPLGERFSMDGITEHMNTIRWLEDPDEVDPDRRYKGLWRTRGLDPWGWAVVVSSDRKEWHRLESQTVIRADDDVRLWLDPDDVPERRCKATTISRSHCGRIAAMWTSPDGIHWHDERETLDFQSPFEARPDCGTTGRIIVEAWPGPGDEAEIHGGFLFRDGQRLLCHYMKWTADGHIYTGLAASRDSLNFTRVGGGVATLPLGEPGTWDAGRVALRERPYRVGDTWRQYYTGCGWKHGFSGEGTWTSHIGFNAPNQMGFAEIGVGKWAHLQVERSAGEGVLLTVPLVLERPHSLAVDVDRLGVVGHGLACEVIGVDSGAPKDGFRISDCDPITEDGARVPVTWKGRGLESTGATGIRLRVVVQGHRTRLFGLHLTPSGA